MKKTNSILRPSEISLTDLLIYLAKHIWVAVLVAMAASMTAWTVTSATLPENYYSSFTLSVRTVNYFERWYDQISSSAYHSYVMVPAINEAQINTDFAFEQADKKLNVVVKASRPESSNLIKITIIAHSPDEAYLYADALAKNIRELPSRASYPNITMDTVTKPTMPEVEFDYLKLIGNAALAASAAGLLTLLLMVVIRLKECVPTTRKAADRLLLLPVASALKKGSRDKGSKALLPMPISETADGCYVENLTEAAVFLLERTKVQKSKHLQITAPYTEASRKTHRTTAERVALNLALVMANTEAKICLIDESGRALRTLGIEPTVDKRLYTVPGSKLTVLRGSADESDLEDFDLTVSAQTKPSAEKDTHTLWVFRSGSYSAAEINEITAPGGGTPSSASVLLYGLNTVRNTKSKSVQNTDNDEIDLLRWCFAAVNVIKRTKIKWAAALALTSVVALAVGLILRYSSYVVNTEFVVVTPDVAQDYSAEQFEEMSIDDALELMSDGSETHFYGTALYPTAHTSDVDKMIEILSSVWSSETTLDVLTSHLGLSETIENVTITVEADKKNDGLFKLSVSGGDKKEIRELTEAFFEVAPKYTAYVANGLTFVVDDSKVSSNGINPIIVLFVAWVAVIVIAIAYALIVASKDRKIYLAYEANEMLSMKVIGKYRLEALKDKDSANEANVSLASIVYEWAEQAAKGSVLMITSALREEGCAELTEYVAALLRRNGKTVTVSNQSADLHAVGIESDFVLLSRPGMAVDCDVKALVPDADSVLWTLRTGYADREILESALTRVEDRNKLLGCVVVTV